MRKVYRCEHTVPPVWWFTFADRNALGEEIVVEFRKNENTHGKHSLPAMWKRTGNVVGRSDLCNGPAGQMFRKVQSDNQGWETEF